MNPLLWQRLIIVGLGMMLWLVTASPVAGCTGTLEDPNKVAVIAEGWVRSAGSAWFSPRSSDNLKVVIDVTRSLKGDVPSPLTLYGKGIFPSGWWSEATSTCGALPSDVSGQYALIMFRRDHNGELQTDRVMGAYFGTGPDDESIGRFRQYIHRHLATDTAATIIPGPTSDLTWIPGVVRLLTVVAAGAVAIPLLAFMGKHTSER